MTDESQPLAPPPASPWDEEQFKAQFLRTTIIARLINEKATPASIGINYWKSIQSNNLNKSLLCIQCIPQLILNFRLPHFRPLPHFGIPKSIEAVKYQFKLLKSYICSPLDNYILNKLTNLQSIQNEVSNDIGELLLLNTATDIQDQIKTISNVLKIESQSKSPLNTNEIPTTLDSLVNHLKTITKVDTTVPSKSFRWWPVALLALLTGFKIRQSSTSIYHWFSTNVVDTGRLFISNWVVSPLYKVFLTIRHDPQNEVVLIAKDSLSSDIASLQRMVVDFSKQLNPHLSVDEIGHIEEAARSGDLTPVMKVYESQIAQPVRNLASGKLVRTALIQVQKAKVDLEVAITGIDKIIQTQQLVFGLIAAIPAIFVIFNVFKALNSQLRTSNQSKSSRSTVLKTLSSLDEILQNSDQQLSSKEIGSIYVEIKLLQQQTDYSQQLTQMLSRLLKTSISQKSSAIVLQQLDRIYLRFGL